jgi:hypothetical protein
MKRQNAYRWIKVGGLLSLIPFVLASGPLAGYLAGYYLIKAFNFPHYTGIVCAIIGIIAGIQETIRIIRAALRAANGK